MRGPVIASPCFFFANVGSFLRGSLVSCYPLFLLLARCFWRCLRQTIFFFHWPILMRPLGCFFLLSVPSIPLNVGVSLFSKDLFPRYETLSSFSSLGVFFDGSSSKFDSIPRVLPDTHPVFVMSEVLRFSSRVRLPFLGGHFSPYLSSSFRDCVQSPFLTA